MQPRCRKKQKGLSWMKGMMDGLSKDAEQGCSCFSGLNMTQKVRWHIAMAEFFFIELDTATLIELDTATC